MYGVMDSNGDLIAFHEEKRVIKKYMEDYFHTNNEHLLPFHIKKKKVSKYKHLYEDLYLIRYGGSYIQSKYLIIKQLDIEPYLDDLYYAKDVLIRTIEFSDSKKDIEKMSECYDILEEEIKKIRKETPSLTTLKNRYVDSEMYQREVDY